MSSRWFTFIAESDLDSFQKPVKLSIPMYHLVFIQRGGLVPLNGRASYLRSISCRFDSWSGRYELVAKTYLDA